MNTFLKFKIELVLDILGVTLFTLKIKQIDKINKTSLELD
jgi:hypothetical protein